MRPGAILSELVSGFDLHGYSSSVRRFFAFAVLLFSGMGLFFLLYNLYLLRLSYQADFIGRMAGLFPVASALAALPTGVLSDRFGRRPFLLASSLVLGASQVGLCLITHPDVLLALSFLGGTAGAFVFVNFIPFLGENAPPERRSQAIAIWMLIQALTRMLVSLVGGALPGVMGWVTGLSTDLPQPFRYALLVGAGATLASAVPLLGMRLPPVPRRGSSAGDAPPAPPPCAQPTAPPSGLPPGEEEAAPSALSSAGGEPVPTEEKESPASPGGKRSAPWNLLLVFGTISGFRGLAWGLSYPFLNVFLQERFSASAATIGLVFFASMVVGLPATLAAPAVARRIGPGLAIVPVRLVGATCLAAMGAVPAFLAVLLLFLLTTAMDSHSVPTEMAFATNTLPRRYWARMQSLRVAGFQILSGLGSFATGVIIVRWGYWLPFLLAGTAQMASVALFLWAFGSDPAARLPALSLRRRGRPA